MLHKNTSVLLLLWVGSSLLDILNDYENNLRKRIHERHQSKDTQPDNQESETLPSLSTVSSGSSDN